MKSEAPKVINAPKEIWLCVGDLSDVMTDTVEFSELIATGDVSWCDQEIEPSDVKYIRADLVPAGTVVLSLEDAEILLSLTSDWSEQRLSEQSAHESLRKAIELARGK